MEMRRKVYEDKEELRGVVMEMRRGNGDLDCLFLTLNKRLISSVASLQITGAPFFLFRTQKRTRRRFQQ